MVEDLLETGVEGVAEESEESRLPGGTPAVEADSTGGMTPLSNVGLSDFRTGRLGGTGDPVVLSVRFVLSTQMGFRALFGSFLHLMRYSSERGDGRDSQR